MTRIVLTPPEDERLASLAGHLDYIDLCARERCSTPMAGLILGGVPGCLADLAADCGLLEELAAQPAGDAAVPAVVLVDRRAWAPGRGPDPLAALLAARLTQARDLALHLAPRVRINIISMAPGRPDARHAAVFAQTIAMMLGVPAMAGAMVALDGSPRPRGPRAPRPQAPGAQTLDAGASSVV